MLDVLFSTAVIASLIVAGCAAFGVSVVTGFLRDRDKLGATMRRVESALERIRREIAEKQGQIRQLQEEVGMLRPVHDRLNSYYEELSALRLEAERKELKENKEKKKGEDEDELFGARRRPRI